MESSPFLFPIRVYQVRPNYLGTGLHVLDMYTLEVTKSGILWWVHHHRHSISDNKQYLQRRMYSLNKREVVPTLQGIRHGQRLTKRQFDKLCRHGLIDPTSINHIGVSYVIS